jgi:hypothetical protein
MIDLKELAVKHGEEIEVTHSDDEIGRCHHVYSFEIEELQAFADEYLALSSSEPVGVIKEELRREDGAVMHYAHLYSHLPLDSQLFLANPINQQLLTERNECVEEIKRLHKILKNVSNNSSTITSNNIFQALKETSTSIQKLLGE